MYRETNFLRYWRELCAARRAIRRGSVNQAQATACYGRLSPEEAARYLA